MRATFDNRPIMTRSIVGISNIHTYTQTTWQIAAHTHEHHRRRASRHLYTHTDMHTHTVAAHAERFCCGCCVRVKTRALCGFGFSRWRESYQHWNNFLLLLPKPKKILKLNTHIKMPCNKRSEEAATATKYRKKGNLGHAEDFIP